MASPLTTPNGLVIIMTNDYKQTKQTTKLAELKKTHKDGEKIAELTELEKTHEDGEKIADVFSELKYDIKRFKNLKVDSLHQELDEVTKHIKYPETYRCIVFVFSGHGNLIFEEQQLPGPVKLISEETIIYTQDCRQVKIMEIVSQFSPKSSPAIAKLPKVFLFDTCLGDKDMCDEAVIVPRRGQTSTTSNSGITGKGGIVSKKNYLPPNGNYILAYATSKGYKSFENKTLGGIWINALAKEIRLTPSESVTNILTKTNKNLLELYQDDEYLEALTQPHYVCYLQDTLCFLPPSENVRTGPPIQPIQTSFDKSSSSSMGIASPLRGYPTLSTQEPKQSQSSVEQLKCVLKGKCSDPKIEYFPKDTGNGYIVKVCAPFIGYAEGEECSTKKMAKKSAADKALEMLDKKSIS